MSDFFSFKRFARYAAKTYRENARRYLAYVLLALCLQVGLVIFSVLSRQFSPVAVPFLILGWTSVVLGVLFVFSEMKPLRSRHTAAVSNTLAVSYFERYLLLFLNTTVVFGVVYVFIFFLVTSAASAVGYGDMETYWNSYRGGFSTIGFMFELFIILIPLAIFAGGTNIRNHLLAFVVVTVVAIPLLGSPTYLPWFINEVFMCEGLEIGGYFNEITSVVQSGNTAVEFSTLPMFARFFTAFQGNGYEFSIWAALLLVAGYFKLKERQVK